MASLPNPETPLAFFPPTLAQQIEIGEHITVAFTAMYVWDWILSLAQEYRMIRRSTRIWPTVLYFMSRISSLGFMTTSVCLEISNVESCQALLHAIATFYVLAILSTTGLFWLRIRAVYSQSRLVQIFFGLFWLVILGCAIPGQLASQAAHIGPTKRCTYTSQSSAFASWILVAVAVYDTLVFFAISWRLASSSVVGDSLKDRLRSFFFGAGLPRVSKGLLQDGQIYYCTTIVFNLLVVVMAFAPGLPALYRGMFVIGNVGIESSMACRLVRGINLGTIREQQGNTTIGTISFPTFLNTSLQRTTGSKLVVDHPPFQMNSLDDQHDYAYKHGARDVTGNLEGGSTSTPDVWGVAV